MRSRSHSQAYSLQYFLPTTIGGDVVRLAGAMQMGYDRAVSLASLVADRLIGALAMIFTVPFGLIPAWHILASASSASAMAVPAYLSKDMGFHQTDLADVFDLV